ICRARPSVGLAAALPGLLAGSACCGPVVLIALGLPVTATVMGLFGWLLPVAAGLLAAALVYNFRQVRATEVR
ncbi:hypothetical protein H0Z60_13310, partial [Ectothiorhodospiraceae bacterium WFHF3C12]|nr:hypothetical protein [Ectothiorhodospiraceae bacterium WFHF3C12]